MQAIRRFTPVRLWKLVVALAAMAVALVGEPIDTRHAAANQRSIVDPGSRLAGTSWVAEEIAGRRLVPGFTPTLRFASDSRASGSSGCAGYSVTFDAIEANTPAIPVMLMPALACADDWQQTRFLQALGRTRRIVRIAGQLRLFARDGGTVMLLRRAP